MRPLVTGTLVLLVGCGGSVSDSGRVSNQDEVSAMFRPTEFEPSSGNGAAPGARDPRAIRQTVRIGAPAAPAEDPGAGTSD